jgi:methylmalonyl-CoA mutase cobalamin-binding subunit
VPTALGVNPSETIAALAERNVEALVGRPGADGHDPGARALCTALDEIRGDR